MADEVKIRTAGCWELFEEVSGQQFEVGKTYKINITGVCEFAISARKPTYSGIRTNEITFTKDNKNHLWIKTKA